MFDLKTDPDEMNNLAMNRRDNGDLLVAMNGKLNALVELEVGEGVGQMLPGGADANWTLDPSIGNLRM
jgi:choline-sulfatase